jgi:hypothetical protein
MLGSKSEFRAFIKDVTPNSNGIHCYKSTGAVAERLLSRLNQIMSLAIKAVNFIKSSASNSRIFNILCSEMNSESIQLLLHTQVKLLSKGTVLQRVYDFHKASAMFFLKKKKWNLKTCSSKMRN